LNAAIRKCSSEFPASTLWLFDAEKAFASHELSEHGIPGARLFHDHVHPTFSGTHILATNCASLLAHALHSLLGKPASPFLLSERDSRNALAYTVYDEDNVIAAMAALTSRPPFLDQLDHQNRQAAAEADLKERRARFTRAEADACVEIYRAAVKRNPADWPIRYNFATLCQALGQTADALREFSSLCAEYPDHWPFRVILASTLKQAGDRAGASDQLRQVLKIDPANTQVREALARCNPSK